MHGRPTSRGRKIVAALMLALAAGGVMVALAACGDGATPAPPSRTLSPSPGGDGGKHGATATPSASPSATAATPSAPTTPSASPTPITDAGIKAGILARIAQEAGLQGFTFDVTVHDGTVYLSGRVRTKQQRSLAEQIALTQPGVKKVVSSIEVKAGTGY
jgi:BON domain